MSLTRSIAYWHWLERRRKKKCGKHAYASRVYHVFLLAAVLFLRLKMLNSFRLQNTLDYLITFWHKRKNWISRFFHRLHVARISPYHSFRWFRFLKHHLHTADYETIFSKMPEQNSFLLKVLMETIKRQRGMTVATETELRITDQTNLHF